MYYESRGKKSVNLLKQVSGGNKYSTSLSGAAWETRRMVMTTLETIGWAPTLSLCRVSIYGVHALPTELLGYAELALGIGCIGKC